MADLIQKNNYESESISRLTQYFKDKENVPKLIEILGEKIQELSNDIWSVFLNRRLANAIGAQLDVLGEIVGEPRGGRQDGVYRLAIKVKIAINNSDGTPETVINVFKLLTGATQVFYQPSYPASVILMGNVDFSNSLFGDGPDAFAMFGGVDGLGFGDFFDSSIGGEFAYLDTSLVGYVYSTMEKVVPAGVGIGYIGIYDADIPFGFDGDQNNEGFGDINDELIGGKFARILPRP